jgi:hypothetical protein
MRLATRSSQRLLGLPPVTTGPKSVLVGLQGLLKKAAGLGVGGWHLLMRIPFLWFAILIICNAFKRKE